MATVHFVRHMREEQVICGHWVITLFDDPNSVVHNVNFETPESCEERGEVPCVDCVDCVDRIPLLDLADTDL